MSHLLSKDQETIVALATPRGSGAIALIRLSGNNVLAVVNKVAKLSSRQNILSQASHTIHHGFVTDLSGVLLDEVLFFVMLAPKTFTGQDTVEISCHNNPFIIENIIAAAVSAGARAANPGEFTQRGFLQGKFDLMQAEAINEIIHASSTKILQNALAQLKGSLSEKFSLIEQEIIMLLTLCEASFEFLEEEQRDIDLNNLVQVKIKEILANIATIKKHFNLQQQIKDGIRISLIGSVNAGKSSLFNALLGKDRAIVADIAGTTRDSIEANLYKNGLFWLLIDTAGLRATNDIIEQQGIEKSYNEAKSADIILLVIDGSRENSEDELSIYENILTLYKDKTIIVLNKTDLAVKNKFYNQHTCIIVSSKNATGIETLEETISKKIDDLFQIDQSTFVLNQRQFNLISEIEKKLCYLESSFAEIVQFELVAYELKDMLEKVYELGGKHVSEGILDTVFNKFCIGK